MEDLKGILTILFAAPTENEPANGISVFLHNNLNTFPFLTFAKLPRPCQALISLDADRAPLLLPLRPAEQLQRCTAAVCPVSVPCQRHHHHPNPHPPFFFHSTKEDY